MAESAGSLRGCAPKEYGGLVRARHLWRRGRAHQRPLNHRGPVPREDRPLMARSESYANYFVGLKIANCCVEIRVAGPVGVART